jgi:hypothetical protein
LTNGVINQESIETLTGRKRSKRNTNEVGAVGSINTEFESLSETRKILTERKPRIATQGVQDEQDLERSGKKIKMSFGTPNKGQHRKRAEARTKLEEGQVDRSHETGNQLKNRRNSIRNELVYKQRNALPG